MMDSSESRNLKQPPKNTGNGNVLVVIIRQIPGVFF
jgi:hypothetical protein